MFYKIIRRTFKRRRKSQKSPNRSDYISRKEKARIFVVLRLEYFTGEYIKLDPLYKDSLKYRRLAIRNQRSRWGSCSSRKNLNFNYRIIDLSLELQDYVIVHELCHLKELHHKESFWQMMELIIPRAREFHDKARKMRIS